MEGQQCDKCKGSFFNLQSDEPEGCIPCFCFQLSKDCKCADFYKDIVSHNTCEKKNWNDFKSHNKMQSIIALWTPRYYGPFNHQGEQPNPDKNQLQTFDWKKVLLQWTLVITRTYSRSRECPQPAEVVYMRSVYRLYFCIERSALIYFSSIFGSFVIMCLFSHSGKHKAKLNCRNMLQMIHPRNFVTKNTCSGNAIRYLHLHTIHLVWHPPPSLKIKKNVHK